MVSHTNALIHEKSPYLLQHAHNPVHWMGWNDTAFEKAKNENKPIFLSIGYSTCHWCHVMEEESFENEAIAEILNAHFVSIKVDREERPDVDHYYMQAVQAMTGQGGWPLNIFLTPDLKPFFGGTYFPPEDKWGHPGFLRVLKVLSEKWQSEQTQMVQSAREMAEALKPSTSTLGPHSALDENTLHAAFRQLATQFEARFGGFDRAPKFPRAHTLSFLLRYWHRFGNHVEAIHESPLRMVEHTLQEIAKGGIYDHLGGGIHRYSTDMHWLVPHFEKMLYDQAIAARAYLEAFQVTQKKPYAEIARDIFRYVLRDLTDKTGTFYSAEDADSLDAETHKKTEGAFYVWKAEDIEKVLGKETADIFDFMMGVEVQGNVDEDPHGEFRGKNILYRARTLEEAALQFSKDKKEIESIFENGKKKLMTARQQRTRPHLDDKILTDWNGLMISALSYGARVLNDPTFSQAATKAADFILKTLRQEDGRLFHRYRDGEAAIEGFLNDYAFLIVGLCDLYEATFQARFLHEAKQLVSRMMALFWDDLTGGFQFTSKLSDQKITPSKELYDGAIPSGNSMALMALLRLSRLTQDRTMEPKIQHTLEAFSSTITQYPAGYPQFLMGLDLWLGPNSEMVLAGKEEDPVLREIYQKLGARFLPNTSFLFHSSSPEAQEIEALVPSVREQTEKEGKAAVYFCRNLSCRAPVSTWHDLEAQLHEDKV